MSEKNSGHDIRRVFVDCHGTLVVGGDQQFNGPLATTLADLRPDLEVIVHSSDSYLAKDTANRLAGYFNEIGMTRTIPVSSQDKRMVLFPENLDPQAVYIDDCPNSILAADHDQTDRILVPWNLENLESELEKRGLLVPGIG